LSGLSPVGTERSALLDCGPGLYVPPLLPSPVPPLFPSRKQGTPFAPANPLYEQCPLVREPHLPALLSSLLSQLLPLLYNNIQGPAGLITKMYEHCLYRT
jgi:hypothetical protein